MKKIMVAVAVLVMATSVMAVGPIAQTAAPVDAGTIIGTAAVGFYTDSDASDAMGALISGRATYGAIENLIASVDALYALEAEVTMIGVAAQYALAMLELPVDLAVRVGYDFNTDATGDGNIVALAVISKQCEALAGLALYGDVGISHSLVDGVDTVLAIGGGAQYDLPVENLAVVAEVQMQGEELAESAVVSVGAVYTF
jgi:hypothetical protein